MSFSRQSGLKDGKNYKGRKVVVALVAAGLLAGGGMSSATASAQAAVTSPNFVANGMFEKDVSGWAGGPSSQLSRAKGENSEGSASIKNTARTAGTVVLNDKNNSVASTVKDHQYRATIRVRAQKANQSVDLRLMEWNKDRGGEVNKASTHLWIDNTWWHTVTVDYTAKHDGSSIDLNVLAYKLTAGKSIYVDNVQLRDMTLSAQSTVTVPETPQEQPAPAPEAISGEETAAPVETAEPAPAPEQEPAPESRPEPTEPEPVPETAPAPETVPSPAPQAPAGYELVWNDEFNGSSVDRTKWNVLNNSTYGDGNKEEACIMDRPENVNVENGVLTIAAKAEKTPLKCGSKDSRYPEGRDYSSGHLETKNKASFEYGRFEVRAKTPSAYGQSKGLWPAFWLRPADGGIGEIDVFEIVGTGAGEKNTADRTSQTIHYDYVKTHKMQNTVYDLPSGTFDDGYHTHAVEWEPGSIKWYVDDVLTYERNTSTTSWLDKAFSRPFYLRLNMAVGGTWPGSPDANTAFPANYEVDYVRVYQESGK